MLRLLAPLALLAGCASPPASAPPPSSAEAPSPGRDKALVDPGDDVRPEASVESALAKPKNDDSAAEESAAPPTVVFIGASVTAGYGTARELGTRRDVDLAAFASAFLPEDRAAPAMVDHSERWFYANANLQGLRLVNLAVDEEPDAIVALDFLFWYAFGQGDDDDPRRARGLENGLEVLEQVDVPLVLGDLPDIEHALRGNGPFGGPIVHRGLFPTEEQRIRMNQRIRAWGAERENVWIVSLADFTADAVSLESFETRGNRWTPDSIRDVLQRDLLHPTTRGTLWVALAALDGLAGLGVLDEPAVDWDVDAASERLQAIAEPLLKKERARAAGD